MIQWFKRGAIDVSVSILWAGVGVRGLTLRPMRAWGLACFAAGALVQAPATILARATVVSVEPGRDAWAGMRGLLRVWNPRRDSERRLEYGLATIAVQRRTGVISIQFLRN